MKKMNILAAAVGAIILAGCSDEIEMRYPPKFELPELPVVEDLHTYKAPLYWSVYEYWYLSVFWHSAICDIASVGRFEKHGTEVAPRQYVDLVGCVFDETALFQRVECGYER